LTASATGLSLVSRNRVPIAIPAAPQASAATRPRPSKNPPAAITGMSTAAATWGTSRLVGTAPTCPPPSPPVAITASMPQPAAFSACRRAPTEAIVTTPASFSAAINSGFGACANEATGTRRVTISRARSAASGPSARRLTPNGRGVRPAVSSIAFSSSARLIVADAIRPRPPASDTAAASRGPDTYPIAACTTG
jgi:hypothetical protein